MSLDELTKTPISDQEIKTFIPEANVMLYSQLKQCNSLPRLPLFLLYETAPKYGHWVLIVQTKEGIEHFDSYSILTDEELKFVPEEFAKRSGQETPWLVQLLMNTGQPIHYNEYKFQSTNSSISTCGRWCALRCLFADQKISQFAAMVKRGCSKYSLNPDQLVCKLVQ